MKKLPILLILILICGCGSQTTELSYEIELNKASPAINLKEVSLINSGGQSTHRKIPKVDIKKILKDSFLIHGTRKNFIMVVLADENGNEWGEVYCIQPKLLKPTGKWTTWLSPDFKSKAQEDWDIMNNTDKYFKKGNYNGVSKLKFMVEKWEL